MKPTSTKNLEVLEGIDNLKRMLQSLAVLDLIMSPEWSYRYYSFNACWGQGKAMASMRNSGGDSFNAVFDSNGCFFKGCSHDCPSSSWLKENEDKWRVVLKKVPNEFSNAASQPAFEMDSISFCFWRTYSDDAWQLGAIKTLATEDPDGSEFLLQCLNADPIYYQMFTKEYFQTNIPLLPIRHVYSHAPITQEIINLLNPEVTLAEIENELLKIGYPLDQKHIEAKHPY
jgi:hypothetical protein